MRRGLLKNMDLETEWGAVLNIEGKGPWRKALCPFHDDHNPSLGVNVKTGVYKCHACGAGGDFIKFYAKLNNQPEDAVEHDFMVKYGSAEIIDDKTIDRLNKDLLSNNRELKKLFEKKGINEATVKAASIGWDGERYIFPVADKRGKFINAIRYKLGAKEKKTLPWSTGRPQALFPAAALQEEEVWLFEGPTDMYRARQEGLNAMTGTNGAGAWRPAWSPLFTGKTVRICYDQDTAGKRGAKRVASMLHGHAAHVILHFIRDDKMPDTGDFNDYMRMGGTLEGFLQMPEAEYIPETGDIVEDRDLEIYPVALAEASRAKWNGKRVRFKAAVAGKMLAPYLIPLEGTVLCKHNFNEDACPNCPVTHKDFKGFKLSIEDPDILSMINIAKHEQRAVLRRKIGIPLKCTRHKIKHKKDINLEEITITPEISYDQQESKHVTRVVYSIGQDMETNKIYEFTAITLPDPRNQVVTHLIYDAKASESNIDQFKIDDALGARLAKMFTPKDWTEAAMDKKLKDIYTDYEAITKIRKRHAMFLAMDLVYHSVRRFKFHGQDIEKGYIDAGIIGETRTGKSETAKQLMAHFKAGNRTTCEGMTFAGLCGGMHQLDNGRWEVSWGEVVMNDSRQYTLDEAHSMPQHEFAKFSDYRSSGIVTLTKIKGKQKAFARTRLWWIFNPPNNEKHLDSFAHPVEALPRLVGRPEDIARFDFVMAAMENEVPDTLVNAKADVNEKVKKYTSDVCHDLIMWCWSRQRDDINFTAKAEEEVLKLALEMGRKYHSSIPLVQSSEQRIKIARIATAVAARFFSTDKTYTKVVVLPEHVKYAHKFLENIYSDPLGYASYSAKKISADTLRDTEWLKTLLDESMKEQLLEWDALSYADLLDALSGIGGRDKIAVAIGGLVRARALRRITSDGARVYVKTRAFVKFLTDTTFKPSVTVRKSY